MPTLATPLNASLRVVVTDPPIPKSYVPNDPPTVFRFSSRRLPIELHSGGRTSITIAVDGPDVLLTRSISPARFSASCSITNTSIPDRRGPKNGKMQIYLDAPKSLLIGTAGSICGRLELGNGNMLTAEAQCVIVEPMKEADRRASMVRHDEPNYEIVPVNRSNWPDYGWDQNNVGDYRISGRTRRLYLVVNLDHEKLLEDLENRTKRGEREAHISSIRNRYLAHVAYHIFQQFESDKSSGPTNPPGNEGSRNFELQRVAKTILQALTSERDLGQFRDSHEGP
jgi:hypothetical protein